MCFAMLEFFGASCMTLIGECATAALPDWQHMNVSVQHVTVRLLWLTVRVAAAVIWKQIEVFLPREGAPRHVEAQRIALLHVVLVVPRALPATWLRLSRITAVVAHNTQAGGG